MLQNYQNCMVLGICQCSLQLALMSDATKFYSVREMFVLVARAHVLDAREPHVAREMLTFLEFESRTDV